MEEHEGDFSWKTRGDAGFENRGPFMDLHSFVLLHVCSRDRRA